MRSVRNVLIVGSGAAGCAAAILFARDGVAVDLIEIKPDLSALGSGITVQGNALRVLRQLGVWNEVRGGRVRLQHPRAARPGPGGTLLVEMDDVRTGGPDLPATVGMYRPALARILTEAAAAAGAKLRFGTTVQSLTQDADGVDVTFSDGTSSRYDLVIGADGIRSRTRSLLGIELETQADRDGNLAGLRAPARQRDPHRPVLRRRLLHRRVLPHRGRHPLRLPRRRRPGPGAPDARPASGDHAGPGRGTTTVPGTTSGPR